MVIFRIRNQRNGRAFIGAVPEPGFVMDYDFPKSMQEDLRECCFSTQIICEYNNKSTIRRKIDKLLEKEINPYNHDPVEEEEAPEEVQAVEYAPVEEEIVFELSLDEIEEYDIG